LSTVFAAIAMAQKEKTRHLIILVWACPAGMDMRCSKNCAAVSRALGDSGDLVSSRRGDPDTNEKRTLESGALRSFQKTGGQRGSLRE